METGVQVEVLFDSKFQPVRDRAPQLKSQLGKILRDEHRIPLTILDWKYVEQTVKDDIWKEVKENLLNIPDKYKDICMKSCNNLWRDHKSKTKFNFFKKNKDDPNLVNNCPPNIVEEQWADLVAYWSSEEAKTISRRNSIVRERRGPIHNTGRKHFAQLRHEMQLQGQEVDKMSVWKISRDNSNPDVADIIIEYEVLLSKELEDQGTLTTVKDRIFHLLMGDDGHRYFRTFGSIVPQNLVYPQSSISSGNTIDLLHKLTETLAQFGEKLERLGDRLSSLESKVDTIERKVDNHIPQILDGSSSNEVDPRSFVGEEPNTHSASSQLNTRDGE